MSGHVYNVKTPDPLTILEAYKLYRRLKFLNQKKEVSQRLSEKQIKGWVMYYLERRRQDCNRRQQEFPGKRATAHNMPKYQNSFDRFLELGFKREVNIETLSNPKKILYQVKLESKQGPKIRKALNNYRTIVGTLPHSVYDWVLYRHWKKWLKVRRGRDLFIPGLGKFNIPEAVKAVQYNNSVAREGGIPYPWAITATGYGVTEYYLEKLVKDPIKLAFVVRHRDYFWPEDQHMGFVRRNRLDEIARAWIDDSADACPIKAAFENPNHTPETLLAFLEERERQREEEQAWRYNRGVTPVNYDWLDKLPDQVHSLGKGQDLILKPIRSTDELKTVGRTLGNCAGGYNREIVERQCVLMVCTDAEGKPLALAEITNDGKGPILAQIEGPQHTEASPEIVKAYHKCLENLLNPLRDPEILSRERT